MFPECRSLVRRPISILLRSQLNNIMESNDTLTFIWAGIIAIFGYVVLDGFDLGIGILFP